MNNSGGGPKVSVIIPCFNEQDRICATIEEIALYFLSEFPQTSYEIIIVDDGSTDSTLDKARSLGNEDRRVIVYALPHHRGRGAALREGFTVSAGELVISLDADLSYGVCHIGAIFSRFARAPELDVVVVSAYMKGGMTDGVPLDRLLCSRVANWLLAGFFDFELHTVTCLARGYRGDKIRLLPLYSDGKAIHLEILRKAALLGFRIEEIPGHLRWRRSKEPRRGSAIYSLVGAKEHLLYGLLVRPSRLAKYLSMVLLVIGLYEATTLSISMLHSFEWQGSFSHSLWLALSASFAQSPHTVVITALALVLGVQAATYWALFEILKLQHEETLRHIIAPSRRPLRAGDSEKCVES